jgi:hypothetical protein
METALDNFSSEYYQYLKERVEQSPLLISPENQFFPELTSSLNLNKQQDCK